MPNSSSPNPPQPPLPPSGAPASPGGATHAGSPAASGGSRGSVPTLFVRELAAVKRRLSMEATTAVGMLESALAALWELDTAAAKDVLSRDESLDREEVAIEEACFRLMALQQPVARDFRALAFVIKVNADVERVGDHACSVAKMIVKLARMPRCTWPTALVELGQRVPIACHKLLRALLDEDPEVAKQVVVEDKTLDQLTRQLFDETVKLMQDNTELQAVGLLIYRLGRELERVGDLMTNIAEDIIYLVTGEIVRHEKKKFRESSGE